ncbi:hypothetical protein ORJ66_10550 [Pseudoalteromonas tunicata]|uniref:DUF6662 family protein n=1 Tax=Pseudoalteromonas tunicata TaxID=314281 RepID=UPI00273F494D|nr:DUF6662 family protein [Pseudoalteromonas tunicata]MDP5213481.1 hypothetical protein [Pseudoalteromonas tunicata]
MKKIALSLLSTGLFISTSSFAGENLLGYVQGAETLPEGAMELYQKLTQRNDKGAGKYRAIDSETEFEYGVTDKFTVAASIKGMSLNTSGIVIDGYMPFDNEFSMKFAGIELKSKYNILSPALDDFGLTLGWSLDYLTVDPHSGQDKKTISFESDVLMQKYFMEGQLVWMMDLGLEATSATRDELSGLPEGFEWPTEAEMEIELKAATGVSYRFVENWSVGFETSYEEEHETEVNLERWSLFAGPSIHYGDQKWWATLTYFKQLEGGAEKFDQQDDFSLHLIEKTKQEVRFKVGFNF